MLAVTEQLVVSQLLQKGYDFLRLHVHPRAEGDFEGEGSISLLKGTFPYNYQSIYHGLVKLGILITSGERGRDRRKFRFILRNVALTIEDNEALLTTGNSRPGFRPVGDLVIAPPPYDQVSLLEDVHHLNESPVLGRVLIELQEITPSVARQIVNEELDRVFRIQAAGYRLVPYKNGLTVQLKIDDE